jgi:predicted phage-related endonuclease
VTQPALAYVPTGPTRDHATYVGGSDAPALVNESRFKTQLAVWGEKTGRFKFAGNDQTELGDHFERPALELYARRRDRDLIYPGTLSHPEIAHIAATPDAIADGKRGVQCKIVGFHMSWDWGAEEDGPDGVPRDVVVQVQYEAALARRSLGKVFEVSDVVAVVGTDLRVFEVPIDIELGDQLIEIADAWWLEHVVGDEMPIVTERDLESLRELYPRVRDEKVQLATDALVDLALEYDLFRENESAARKSKQRTAAKLIAAIKDGGGFAAPSQGIKVTFDEKAGSTSWKDVARHFRHHAALAGVSEALLDEIERDCKGEPGRVLNVRVKE